MSFVNSILPFVPYVSKMITSVASGYQQKAVSKESAERLEAIGRTQASLRRIQGTKLLGKIQASFGARGVSGGVTDADLEGEAAHLEEVDAAFAQFRYDSLADQVKRSGEAAVAQGWAGGMSALFDMIDTAGTIGKINDLEGAIKTLSDIRSKSTVPTVVQPAPGWSLRPFPK